MDPNQPQVGVPVQYGPPNYNNQMGPGQPQNPGQMPAGVPRGKKSNLPMVVGAVVGAIVFIIIGLVIGMAASPKKAAKPAVDTSSNGQNQGPQPATEIGVTQTSNSISQDISANNEDKDLPSTLLDDKALSL